MAQTKDELIKVHVTPTQREYLEFLVNRRLNDVRIARGAYGVFGPSWKTIPEPSEEERQLEALKHELSQAGT